MIENALCSADLVGQLKDPAVLTAVSFRVWYMAFGKACFIHLEKLLLQ